MRSVSVEEIDAFLRAIGQRVDAFGERTPDARVDSIVPLDSSKPGTFSWLRAGGQIPEDWNGSLLLAGQGTRERPPTGNAPWTVVSCRNPRLALIRVVDEFFRHLTGEPTITISDTACVHPTAVLGTPGQGYEWDDEAQQWLAMPHFAGVVVGDDVEIGPACTVMRGVLQDTYIGNGSRIGNGVNIGHGARIGAHCLITAHCTVGGSAALGDKVVLWQNVSVGSGVSVGAGAVVGMGAVLLERVPRGEVWAGNPARRIR